MSALLWPAIINGWPLIFFDTGGYLDRGYDLTLGFGRSLYYGLFLRSLSWPVLGLWPVIVVQSALVTQLLLTTLRVHRIGFGQNLGLIAVLGLLTGLPFFVAQLMPDCFLAILVLAVYLKAFHSLSLAPWERHVLTGLICLSCLVHMAHLAMALGLIMVLGAWRLLVHLKRIHIPWFGVTLAIVILPIGNGLIGGSFGPTPGGSVFLLGRFVQDGLAQQVLGDLCPDPRLKLCAFKDDLPRNANDFLWGGDDAALRQSGGFAALEPEARIIIWESLIRYPLENIRTAAQAALDQFIWFSTGEGLDGALWHARWRLQAYRPDLLTGFDAALQQQKPMIDLAPLSQVHATAAWIGLALFCVMTMQAGLQHAQFLSYALVVLLGNAVICGVFSNPQGRYQDKVIWIVMVGVFLVPGSVFNLGRLNKNEALDLRGGI
jgi:hypothetical protein